MTIERDTYERGWGECSFCRTQRPFSALEVVGRAMWNCRDAEWCSEAQLIRAHRLAAREAVDRTNPEPDGYAEALANAVAGAADAERAREEERKKYRREYEARRRAEKRQGQPPPKRGRRPINGTPMSNAERQRRKREKALARRLAEHRKERES